MDSSFDLIERYCRNELQGEDLRQFQVQLMASPALTEDVARYRQTKTVLEGLSDDRLHKRLSDIGRSLFDERESRKKVITLTPFSLSIAASVLLFISVVYLAVKYFDRQPDASKLYAAHFEVPDIGEADLRSRVESVAWSEAISAYHNRDFSSAAGKLEVALADSSFALRSAASFYLGICHLMDDKSDEALDCFGRVSAESVFSQQAEWYTGLTLLKQGKADAARQHFVAIVARPGHYKNEEARLLLEELDLYLSGSHAD